MSRSTDPFRQLYQNRQLRRSAVFVTCGLLAYAAWVAVRWETLPGTGEPVWSIPWWGKVVFLGAATALFFALFRLGGWLIRDARKVYAPNMGFRSSALSVRWYRYLNPVGPLYNLYLNRDLLRQFTRREIEGRYRGSYLGMVWSMILPLMMLAIYTFVFTVIFKSQWENTAQDNRAEFAMLIFAGLIAFNAFSECVSRAPGLIVGSVNYVKKVIFPLEVLPVVTLGTALFHALVSVGILMVASLLLLHSVSATIVFLPLVALPLIGLCLGLGWFFAALGVYVRDTAYAVSVALQVLFFLSAVFYPVTAVPEFLRPLMYLNPLTAIFENFRRVLVWNLPPDWGSWLIGTLIGGMVVLLGYTWFMKTKSGFADVI
jgi:lipopolysaccharide transport system permease protein